MTTMIEDISIKTSLHDLEFLIGMLVIEREKANKEFEKRINLLKFKLSELKEKL